MTSEHGQDSKQAGVIIQKLVTEFRNKEPNPSLRMLATLCAGIITQMKQERIPSSEYPLAAHIGDISPEIDPEYEKTFLWLRDLLGFTPESRQRLFETEERLRQQPELKGVNPSRYDPEVMGLPLTRQLLVEDLSRYGFNLGIDNVRLVDGGTAAYNLAFSVIAARVWNQKQQRPRLLAPTPTYTMAINCAQDKGMQTQLVDATQLSNQELTAEALLEFHRDQPEFTPDLMYLVPTNNPTARVACPEQLQELLEQARQLYPEMQYCFDLAYLGLIPLAKARAMIKAINDSDINPRSFFCYSDSKRLMNPGARWGALVAPADLQEQVGAYAKRGSFSTYSRNTDLAWAALLSDLSDYRNEKADDLILGVRYLFRQRQVFLLDYLRQVNSQKKLFADLPSTPPDIPLYLWLRLNQGVDAYDVIEQLRIVGVPGSVFGDPRYMRFAVGALPSGLIQARLSSLL